MLLTVFRRAVRAWASLTAALISFCEGSRETWTPFWVDLDLDLSFELLAMKERLTLSGWKSRDFLR